MDPLNNDDLAFTTSVDGTIKQNVPIPPVPTHASIASSSAYGMSGPMDPGTLPPGQDGGGGGPVKMTSLSQSSHPVVCLFHFLFKILALVLYIFGGWFAGNSKKQSVSGSNFITVTVVCILLLAADFWVVKNVTGRLLVGLRWWNKVEPDGSATRWIFESAEVANRNRFDNTVFWSVLYGTPLVWSSLFLLALLKLQIGWLITVSIAISLSGANLYGYWKCSSDQKAKFRKLMADGAQMGAMSLIRNNFFGFLAGTNAAAANAASAQQQGGGGSTTYV